MAKKKAKLYEKGDLLGAYVLFGRDLLANQDTDRYTNLSISFDLQTNAVALRFPIGRTYRFRDLAEMTQAFTFAFNDAKLAQD